LASTKFVSRNTRFGNYVSIGHVGTGGFSDVYEAKEKNGHRRVAIKVFRTTGKTPENVQSRIRREKEILSNISTRNVARLVDSDLNADPPWIASEFVEGKTLKELVETSGKLSHTQIRAITESLARTLEELHGAGVAHRDLTPSNIIMSQDGPVLIDFGTSRQDLDHLMTGTVQEYGTPGYASPEVEAGEKVGAPADIFSLARVAQFMSTGEIPGSSLSGDDPDLFKILEGAMSLDPNERPTAIEIVNRFSKIGKSFISWDSLFQVRKIKKLPRRIRPSVVASLVLLTAGIALISGFFLFSSEEKPVTFRDLLPQVEEGNEVDVSVYETPGGVVESFIYKSENFFEPERLSLDYSRLRRTSTASTGTAATEAGISSEVSYGYVDAYDAACCIEDDVKTEILVELLPYEIRKNVREEKLETGQNIDFSQPEKVYFDAAVEHAQLLDTYMCPYLKAEKLFSLSSTRLVAFALSTEDQCVEYYEMGSHEVEELQEARSGENSEYGKAVATIFDSASETATTIHFFWMENLDDSLAFITQFLESLQLKDSSVIQSLPEEIGRSMPLVDLAGFPSNEPLSLPGLEEGVTSPSAFARTYSSSNDQGDFYRVFIRLEPEQVFELTITDSTTSGAFTYFGLEPMVVTAYGILPSPVSESSSEDTRLTDFTSTISPGFGSYSGMGMGRWRPSHEGEFRRYSNNWPYPIVVVLEVKTEKGSSKSLMIERSVILDEEALLDGRLPDSQTWPILDFTLNRACWFCSALVSDFSDSTILDSDWPEYRVPITEGIEGYSLDFSKIDEGRCCEAFYGLPEGRSEAFPFIVEVGGSSIPFFVPWDSRVFGEDQSSVIYAPYEAGKQTRAADDPGLTLILDTEQFSTLIDTYKIEEGLLKGYDSCEGIYQWKRDVSKTFYGELNVYLVTGCSINLEEGYGYRTQANPIFEFNLETTAGVVLIGTYVPSSWPLDHWLLEDLLDQIVDNAELFGSRTFIDIVLEDSEQYSNLTNQEWYNLTENTFQEFLLLSFLCNRELDEFAC